MFKVFNRIMYRVRSHSKSLRFVRDARGFRHVYVNGVHYGAIGCRKSNYGVPVFYAINMSHMRISGSFRFCLRLLGAIT